MTAFLVPLRFGYIPLAPSGLSDGRDVGAGIPDGSPASSRHAADHPPAAGSLRGATAWWCPESNLVYSFNERVAAYELNTIGPEAKQAGPALQIAALNDQKPGISYESTQALRTSRG